MNSTNQISRYFFGSDRFFSLHYDRGPVAFRNRVGDVVTKAVNKQIKRSRLYRSARESAHAQVVLHGPGALVWRNRRSPLPTTAGIEDILIPEGTLCDMSNLNVFAIYRELVWGQLEDAAFGPAADPGWNKEYVGRLLATLYKLPFQPIYQGNRWLFPEKLQEDYKEGAWGTYSSSLPKVLAWDFFHLNEDTGKWNRKMVLDYANISANYPAEATNSEVVKERQLLYTRDDYANDWSEIIHWYIGNCSNVAPYRFHSIRSIGYLLYGVSMLSNKMMCRMSDHTFQQLLTWFRNVSEDNREKLGLIDLGNFGIMPDGVSMVAAQERHVADWSLVMGTLNQYRQLMAESSQAFVPDMQSALGAGGKELTATEALIRQNTSVNMTNAVLSQLGDQSLYEYREQWRRFCMRANPDPVAKAFREEIKREGVPLEVLDYEAWNLLPETVVGSGNKASELTVTQALLQELFPLVDPNAQRIILRRRYMALTDNPDEAMAAVPEAPEAAMADDKQYAQFAFSILMDGQPFMDKEGVNHGVMAGTLLQLVEMSLQQAQAVVNQPDGVAIAAQKVAGATNVLNHTQQEIMKVGQSGLLKQLAKQLVGKWQELRGALQEVAAQVQKVGEQSQANVNPEMAKLQAKLMDIKATGDLQRDLAAKSADQKLQQRNAQWQSTTQQKEASTAADIQRESVTSAVDLHHADMKVMGELHTKAILAQADAEIAKQKAAREPVGATS
jgi:hypothetical protein